METDKVKDEVRKLENFNHDIFNHKNESRWKDLFQQFVHNTDGIDTAVLGLIQTTF